jgi:precorrin-2 dehydrogenase/sirohydrochlorin ferrochelatase
MTTSEIPAGSPGRDMQRFYPIFLDLEQKPVIVIGGGNVACEKVAGLRRAGARITLVSPTLAPELQELKAAGELQHIARAWQESDLDGDWVIVMVATDDGAVNREVTAASRSRRLWVNAADNPVNCDFILPSVVRKGKITLAASTAGSSPALARRLREELDAYLTDDMPALAELLEEVRNDLRQRKVHVQAETWQQAIDGQLRVLLAQRRYGQAKARLIERLGVGGLLPLDPAGEPVASAVEPAVPAAAEQVRV